jgi:hypothetical protein
VVSGFPTNKFFGDAGFEVAELIKVVEEPPVSDRADGKQRVRVVCRFGKENFMYPKTGKSGGVVVY